MKKIFLALSLIIVLTSISFSANSWKSGKKYVPNSVIKYKGYLYTCIDSHYCKSEAAPSDSIYWKSFGKDGSKFVDWLDVETIRKTPNTITYYANVNLKSTIADPSIVYKLKDTKGNIVDTIKTKGDAVFTNLSPDTKYSVQIEVSRRNILSIRDYSVHTAKIPKELRTQYLVVGLGTATESLILTSKSTGIPIRINVVSGYTSIRLPEGSYRVVDADPKSSKMLINNGKTVKISHGRNDPIIFSFKDLAVNESSSDDEVVNQLSSIISFEEFKQMFPNATEASCTAKTNGLQGLYDGLIEASQKFPAFANPLALPDEINNIKISEEKKTAIAKRELAAFLAIVAQQTDDGLMGWGLCHTEEISCQDQECSNDYLIQNNAHKNGRSYHGRGMLQLTWNSNYAEFQSYYNTHLSGGDLVDLISDPSLLLSDNKIAWSSALWLWMDTQEPKPSAHDVITGIWQPTISDIQSNRVPGFGMAINVIDGDEVCDIATPTAVDNRISYFNDYANILSTSIDYNIYCNIMAHY